MPNCTHAELTFPSFDRRKIEANFSGGDVSSDGGILLLREADRRLGLVEALDAVLPDPRDPQLITHRQADLLRQRIYGLALGYEDLNDHATLRQDLSMRPPCGIGRGGSSRRPSSARRGGTRALL